jgi:hypothetical protein
MVWRVAIPLNILVVEPDYGVDRVAIPLNILVMGPDYGVKGGSSLEYTGYETRLWSEGWQFP